MANLIRRGAAPTRASRRDLDDPFFEDIPSVRSLLREMDDMFEDFRLFGDVFRPTTRGVMRAFRPTLQITEGEKEYFLTCELPGMSEEDIDVSIDDSGMLTIQGEKRVEETGKVQGAEYSERGFGRFSRSISLPPGVDASNVKAEMRNGVLEVHIPRTEVERARKIPIGRAGKVITAGSEGGRQMGTGGQQKQPEQAQMGAQQPPGMTEESRTGAQRAEMGEQTGTTERQGKAARAA